MSEPSWLEPEGIFFDDIQLGDCLTIGDDRTNWIVMAVDREKRAVLIEPWSMDVVERLGKLLDQQREDAKLLADLEAWATKHNLSA